MVPKAFEAGYPNTTGFRKVVKVTILIKKKEGMSDEAFIEHYNNVHAKRAVPIVQRHGVISYGLTYHLNRDRKLIQDIMHQKAKLADYDAICTFVFPDYLALAKFMYDKEGAALNGDHENFMDDSQMRMMVGDEYILIENGESVQ
ncbi:EthD domain-domain-containing protein [Clohesyomyces aquaticus]|uniref:EthD domain-domain-containing protein n=1 Tax=Clohesyomyces aquaticus TaxID=1231657 RepID=A0A1Y1YH35_9PLEO|nr:EthD domain-domain-containing protein [Clohesyomyces aquaticus]